MALETVVRNLVGNAFKHHPYPVAGEVTIAAQMQDGWLEVTVTDNGAGIDPRFHTRIFEIFKTLKPRDEVEGSGVGLAVVKKLVETQGGAVQVISASNEGPLSALRGRYRFPQGQRRRRPDPFRCDRSPQLILCATPHRQLLINFPVVCQLEMANTQNQADITDLTALSRMLD